MIFTSGDDNKLMVWDPDSRTMAMSLKVTDRREKAKRGGASSMSRLPDSQCSRSITGVYGSWFAVAGNDGKVSIRADREPKELHLLGDSTEWIEVMSFSPDGNYLAVGSHDNTVYVYRTSDWKLNGKCTGHSSYVMALDWSADSKIIRSNCGAYELLFFTAENCERDPSGRTNYQNTEWATVTCKFLWQTEGIYPSGTDGTHVNSVCGSHDK